MIKAFVGPAEAIALPVLCSSNFEEHAVIASTGDGLRARVDAAWRLPQELRAALRGVLDRIIPAPGLTGDPPPLRHIEKLASVEPVGWAT